MGHLVGRFWRQRLVEFRSSLATHTVLCSGPIANPAIAGTVDDDRRVDADFFVRGNVFGVNACYPRSLLLNSEGVPAQQ